MTKKALLVARVSGFVPQFEMNNVKLLQKMGYEVHYASNFDVVVYGTDNSRLAGTQIITHQIPFCQSPFSPDVYHSYQMLSQLLQEEEFDLIHCHMPLSSVVTRMAAQHVRRRSGRNVPVLYTTHGFHFFKGAPLTNWLYYIPERWLARYTDRLITINAEDNERAKTFAVRGEVERLPGVGIDVTKKVNMDKKEKMKLRHRLGVQEEDFLLISVGELNANKNHIRILEMLSKCHDKKLKYVICGIGPLQEKLKTYVRDHGMENQVSFLGYCTEVAKMLACADCFVFPSLREGLPVALMEAMRAGLPVVAKKIRGNRDLIEHDKGGFLLKKGSCEEYEEAVLFFESHRKEAQEMGLWNQQRVKAFSLQQVEKKMRRIYEEVSN